MAHKSKILTFCAMSRQKVNHRKGVIGYPVLNNLKSRFKLQLNPCRGNNY